MGGGERVTLDDKMHCILCRKWDGSLGSPKNGDNKGKLEGSRTKGNIIFALCQVRNVAIDMYSSGEI